MRCLLPCPSTSGKPIAHFCGNAPKSCVIIRSASVLAIRSWMLVTSAISLTPPASIRGLFASSTSGTSPSGFGAGQFSPSTGRGFQLMFCTPAVSGRSEENL
jgi:hypothetical protein